MLVYTHSFGGIVVNARGQVLIVQQRGQTWSFPKGKIEAGEDPLACARREIYEEAGVSDLEMIEPLGSYHRNAMKDGVIDLYEFKRLTFFLFRTEKEELSPRDPNNPIARWVDADDVAALLAHPADSEFFTSIRYKLMT